MRIREYYRRAAMVSVNNSIFALFFAGLFIVFAAVLLPGRGAVLFSVPFLLYSFLSFQKYALIKQRSLEIAEPEAVRNNEGTLFQSREMILQFLPAPSLRLLIFRPDGLLIGEIRDLEFAKFRWFLPGFADRLFSGDYGLFNEKNQLIAVFRWRKNIVEASGLVSSYGILKRKGGFRLGNCWSMSFANKVLLVKSEPLFTDIKFTDAAGASVARVRKGWMPLEWEPYIKNANAPVLSFNEKAAPEERMAVIAVLAHMLRYRDH